MKRKILAYGDSLMKVEAHFEEGSIGAMHLHPHSQLTYVLSGEFEFMVELTVFCRRMLKRWNFNV